MSIDFYQKLISYKATKKLKWEDIGDVVDMKPATIRIAINRESLTELEKREIQNCFFENNKTENTHNKNEDNDSIIGSEVEKAVLICLRNKDLVLQDDLFSSFVEERVSTKLTRGLFTLANILIRKFKDKEDISEKELTQIVKRIVEDNNL